MSPVEIGIIMLIATLVLLFLGTHIGIALILPSFLGVWWIRGDIEIATRLLSLTANDALANYLFAMVPLFVLMGLVVDRAGIGRDTFDVAQWLVGRFRGGLGSATVMANAIFAAITGISVASAALFTRVAVPQMVRLGYQPRFAVGAVAGSSVLGMLIPPSLLLMLYGIITETSIGKLFIAGIVPGILLALVFCIKIYLLAVFWPNYVTDPDFQPGENGETSENALSIAKKILPSLSLILIVLGGIYGGVFTVTEAAAAGAAVAIIIALVMRRISWTDFRDIMRETAFTSTSILFLILGASIYSKLLTFSMIPQNLLGAIQAANFGFYPFVSVYIIFLIGLGMILDSASILLITIPLVLPIMQNFGTDMVWFGIISVIAVEIGLLTPPFGLSVYVVEAALKDVKVSLVGIFQGSFPYVLSMLVILIALIIFPQIALLLPNLN